MKEYKSKIHNRKSIRLKDYDYSKVGLYFITICIQNRLCLFGNVDNGNMVLNDAGQMVLKWYNELENKYPDKKCHEMVIMPNHFHCIIENIPMNDNHSDAHVGTSLRGRPEYGIENKKYNATICDAIGWFKTMTTNEYIRGVKQYNWKRFDNRLWQLKFWDHIIRNDSDYNRIANYIIDNPVKWNNDKFNPK